jgi:predicted nucleic acid-binding protein
MRQKRRPGTVIIDSEAVDALADPGHPKHRDALAYIEVTNERRATSERVRVVVPTAVRVEARWDRRGASAANLNRICGAHDHPLDTAAADRAAELARLVPSASVVDATVAQAAEAVEPAPTTVVTSDDGDFRRLAAHLQRPIVIVRT